MRAWTLKLTTLFLTLIVTLSLTAAEVKQSSYIKPDWVSEGLWEELKPDLLPFDHPIKPALDKIFKSHRVTESAASFMGAGFVFHEREGRRRVIARHLKLPGYLVKTYLDTHRTHMEDGLIWRNRINGARQLQACIDKHNYNHLMKVPKKWLYPIPCNNPSRSPYPKGYALIVEDAKTLSHLANYRKYANEITKEQVKAIYVMLYENHAFDCVHVFNIPFCKDGKIAWIDTEGLNAYHHPISYWKMTEKLPKELRPYWEKLYKQKNKKK